MEFTLIFSLVMVPGIVGVTDIAGLLDTHVNLVYAARQGARTGAVLGNNGNADCEIVGAINATLLNQPNVNLTEIDIFQVTYGGTVTGNEEVYPGGDSCNLSGVFVVPPSTDTWHPSSRNTTPFNEDSIGIKLYFTYTWQFNLLGFGPFSGYDVVQYPMNPNGEPTPLPAPTLTPTCVPNPIVPVCGV